MVTKRLVNHGVGVVFFGGLGVWALWVREADGFRVRMSLDDFAALGVHEYQRVQVRLPFEPERERPLYLRSRIERPPFVWLVLSSEVRRIVA